MKRTYAQKSPFCRHTHDSTKSSLLNKTNRFARKSSTISIKKAIKENNYYHHPYLTKKKRRSFCGTNNNSIDSNTTTTTITSSSNPCHNGVQEDLADPDPNHLSTLRHEAYDELHRQMQQYNDSFVIRMQQAEQQRNDAEQRSLSHHRRRSFHRRRSSLVSPSSLQHNHHHQHHRPRLYYCHQEKNESGIEELVDMLESGTIKDYSLLTEWELCQNPQIELEEEQHGGLGDLW